MVQLPEGGSYWHPKIIKLCSNGQSDNLIVTDVFSYISWYIFIDNQQVFAFVHCFSYISWYLFIDNKEVFAFVHWFYTINDISDLCAQRPAQKKNQDALHHCLFITFIDMIYKAGRLLSHQWTHAVRPPSNYWSHQHRRLLIIQAVPWQLTDSFSFVAHSQLILYDDNPAESSFISHTDQFSCWAFNIRPVTHLRLEYHLNNTWKLHILMWQGVKQSCLGKECQFSGIYNPNSHCQRYCIGFNLWFYLGCLKEMKEKPTLGRILGHECHPNLAPQFICFISTPIERGSLAGIVRNGRPHLQAWEWVRNGGKPPGGWVKDIGEGYVEKQESLLSHFIYFQCPTCDGGIW